MMNFRKRGNWMTPMGAFHWVNGICIICLVLLGTIMMFREDLGFASIESKIALKHVHTYVGYVFVFNLIWRAIAGLIFRPHRIPDSKINALAGYMRNLKSGQHSRADVVRASSWLVSTAMFALLTTSAVTGLIRTGTDLYLPPVGPLVARWIAETPDMATELDPLNKNYINQGRLSKLNRIKVPVGQIHKWSAYLLMVMIILHVRLIYDLSRRTTAHKSESELDNNHIPD